MLHCYCPDTANLLEDLLEASDSLYHRNVATIQRVFMEQYFLTLAHRRANDTRFREGRLQSYRQALKTKQIEMIQEQTALWRERNANIRAYVSARTGPRGAAA